MKSGNKTSATCRVLLHVARELRVLVDPAADELRRVTTGTNLR
jgi:hypothetical protein